MPFLSVTLNNMKFWPQLWLDIGSLPERSAITGVLQGCWRLHKHTSDRGSKSNRGKKLKQKQAGKKKHHWAKTASWSCWRSVWTHSISCTKAAFTNRNIALWKAPLFLRRYVHGTVQTESPCDSPKSRISLAQIHRWHIHPNRIIVHRWISWTPEQYWHQHQLHNRGRMWWQTCDGSRCTENPRTHINTCILDQIDINNLWLRHSWTGNTRLSVRKKTNWQTSGTSGQAYAQMVTKNGCSKQRPRRTSNQTPILPRPEHRPLYIRHVRGLSEKMNTEQGRSTNPSTP